MKKRLNMRHGLFLATAALGLMVAGCATETTVPEQMASSRPSGSGERMSSSQAFPVELTGTLRGGIMAIGGETTGWQLELPRGVNFQADVTALENPEQYEGRRLRLAGHFETRAYVELGPTTVFVVRETAPAR